MSSIIPDEPQPKKGFADDYTDMANLAMRLPDEIMAYEKHIIALGRNLDGLNKRKKELELSVSAEVAGEKIELDGKVKPKYSNSEMRDAETQSRLRRSPEYLEINQEIGDRMSSLREKEAELNRLKNQMRSLEIVTDVLKIKYRVGI